MRHSPPCAPRSFVLLLVSGQLGPSLSFVARHPSSLGYILMLSAVSTAVQVGGLALRVGGWKVVASASTV